MTYFVRTLIKLVAGFIAIFGRILETIFHRISSVTKCDVNQILGNQMSGNQISVHSRISHFLVRISTVVFFFLLLLTLSYTYYVLGLELQPIFVNKIQSMLLGRAIRFLFYRFVGWDVPLILLLCLLSGQEGYTLYMEDPAGGEAPNLPMGVMGPWLVILRERIGSMVESMHFEGCHSLFKMHADFSHHQGLILLAEGELCPLVQVESASLIS